MKKKVTIALKPITEHLCIMCALLTINNPKNTRKKQKHMHCPESNQTDGANMSGMVGEGGIWNVNNAALGEFIIEGRNQLSLFSCKFL